MNCPSARHTHSPNMQDPQFIPHRCPIDPPSGRPCCERPSPNDLGIPRTIQLEISSQHIAQAVQKDTLDRIRMQNSTVIGRVNAGLSRCLSHHRRLCRGIAELDRLIYNDEFLKDPRTQWLLHQRRQKEEEKQEQQEAQGGYCRLLGQSRTTLSPPSGKVGSSKLGSYTLYHP